MGFDVKYQGECIAFFNFVLAYFAVLSCFQLQSLSISPGGSFVLLMDSFLQSTLN